MTPKDSQPATGHRPPPPHHHAHEALHLVRSHIQPGSFPALLAASLVLYAINGLALEEYRAAFFLLGRALVLVTSLYVLSANRATLWLGLGLMVVEFGTGLPGMPVPERPLRLVQDSAMAAFLLWVFAVVLREVFRPATTERNAVVGALCGFMLMLTAFARIHALIEAWMPGAYQTAGPAFAGRPEADVVATFQYFSTITLTTVGFGDIVPVTPAARLATGLEAMAGQVYLAVVIASLVGRVASSRRG